MARVVSGQDAAMDDTVEPQDAREALPIPRCRCVRYAIVNSCSTAS
jgi:hypothetical protein